MSRSPPSLIIAAWMLLLPAVTGGCVQLWSGPEDAAFSPDGSKLAYLWVETLREFTVDGKTLCRTLRVEWCEVASPRKRKSLAVGSLGLDWGGYVSVPTAMAFSPDSRRLAVVVPWRLSVLFPAI